jgi:hypothetical protein
MRCTTIRLKPTSTMPSKTPNNYNPSISIRMEG